MKTAATLFITFLACSCASITLPGLRDELIAMRYRDQQARQVLIEQGTGDAAAVGEMMRVDSAHTLRLKEIVRQHGYPTPELVGGDAVEAAFLLVQHSPDLAFQKEYLPTLVRQAESGDVEKQDVALLTDRILINENKPQIYGTQLQMVDGRLVPYPIENEAGVDQRRTEMGLPDMKTYVELVNRMYKTEEAGE